MPELHTNRGNESDYVFGSPLGWDAFDVVRWKALDGLNELFAYDIVLVRPADSPAIDIAALCDAGATFAIATASRWRQVHGVVAEAELIEQTSGLALYRVVMVPHLWRAGLRRRCRTFVDRSIKGVVSDVLENKAAGGAQGRGLRPHEGSQPSEPSFAAFSEPAAYYRWAVSDDARLAKPRPFIVQYNESDLAFVQRLLEGEGISFFFEHAADGSVLTLSDRPGAAPLAPEDAEHELVGSGHGGSRVEEVVRAFRPAQRLRPSAVVMRDHRWRASLTKLEARESGDGASELEHFEFPAADEDQDNPGRAPARFLMERHLAERAESEGYGGVRTHAPGRRFRLIDRAGVRPDADLVCTRVETHAVQLLPEGTQLDLEPIGIARPLVPSEPFFETRFHAVPADLQFRPKRTTEKRLIMGVQTARVTAEEVGDATELNSDKFGRVRIRFPWDQRENDGTPTSKWVRVSQYWAGAGYGALYVPRVGHEVVVAFERGDPERPIVVGRVYNEQNPPPYAEPNTTKSTIKSDSVGGDGSSADGFNELRFEDAAAKEQVFLHAQRNLDEVVRASHSTTVGGNQSNTVGGDQSNTVYGSREHHVCGTELVKVDGDRTTVFGASEFHQVAANRVTGIGGNDSLGVNGHHSITVGADQEIHVAAARDLTVGATHAISVGAAETLAVGGPRSVTVAGPHLHTAPTHVFMTSGAFSSTAAEHIFMCDKFTVIAGGATLTMAAGMITLNNGGGASITMAGGLIAVTSGNYVCSTGARMLNSDTPTTIHAGGPLNLIGDGNINGTGPLIKLNG